MTRAWGQEVAESQFDRIAQLLEEHQRPQFFRLMAHLREVPADDEILRIIEAMGFLALITREVPAAIAGERAKLEAAVRSAAAYSPADTAAEIMRQLGADGLRAITTTLTERGGELSQSCVDFAGAIQAFTDPDAGATARINRALVLMQAELENASLHVRSLSGELRRQLKQAIATVAVAAAAGGFLAGWIVGRL